MKPTNAPFKQGAAPEGEARKNYAPAPDLRNMRFMGYAYFFGCATFCADPRFKGIPVETHESGLWDMNVFLLYNSYVNIHISSAGVYFMKQ